MRPPVFVVGMHRSGTTLLIELLRELGLFTGQGRDPNAEAWYFLRRNEWILRRAGGAWDQPRPVRAFLAQPELRKQLVHLLSADLHQRFKEFAPRGGIRSPRLDAPWGCKDPRMCFTLEIWREVFPDCRVVLVRRNGIDVAKSLVTRAQEELRTDPPLCVRPLHKRLKAMWHPFEFLPHWSMPTRCFDVDAAFSLWEEYVEAAEAAFAAFPGEKMVVRYEDLLHAPAAHLGEIAGFCGLAPAADLVAAVAGRVDGSRRLAFARDPELRGVYEKVKDSRWMRKLGYDALELDG